MNFFEKKYFLIIALIFSKLSLFVTAKKPMLSHQLFVYLDSILIEVYSLDVTLIVVSAAFNSVVSLTILESV
ncbi:hypothetical protein GCM10008918_21260 [Lactobacillus kefiranofaciens subsp. kefiranofaciens]